MTDTLMATDRTAPGSDPKLQPLIPVGIFGFLVSALVWYRIQVAPGTEIDGNWLVDLIGGLHGAVGFAPAFLVAVLGLAWASIWFFTNRVPGLGGHVGPGGRLTRILVFGLCLSILDGFGAEPGTAGELGSYVAVRIESVFGQMLGTTLASVAVFASFLLATDFCFYRFFEPLRERTESAGTAVAEAPPVRVQPVGETLPEAEVEDEAVSALMGAAVLDEPGVAEKPETAVAEEPELAENEVEDAVEAARSVLEVLEDDRPDDEVGTAPSMVFDDPLEVDEEEQAQLLGEEAPEDDDPDAGVELPFSDDVPTIVDIGQSSIELPVAIDEPAGATEDLAEAAEVDDGEDLAFDTALHESVETPSQPDLFGQESLDPAEIEALSADPAEESEAHALDDGETAESASHREEPTPLEGLLFPEPAKAAEELEEEEFDDLIAEVSSLAQEVEELTRDPARSAGADDALDGDQDSDSVTRSGEPAAPISQGALFPAVSDSELLSEAAELVRSTGRASVGLLARRLRIEWDQADEVLVQLADQGIVEIDDESGQVRVLS